MARTGLFYLVNKEANFNTLIIHHQDLWGLKRSTFLVFLIPAVAVGVHQAGDGFLWFSPRRENSQTVLFLFSIL